MKKRIAETIGIARIIGKFSTERKAVKWLEKTLWGNKPICPHCGGIEHISVSKKKKFTYWHKDCRKQFTIKTNTIMHASKITFQQWAITFYYVLTARKGVSSLQLSKELDITQKSAWFLLQRVREGFKQKDIMLDREVEIDETYIGGKESNKHKNKRIETNKGCAGKAIVMGMRERKGRTRTKVIERTDCETLHGEITNNIEPFTYVYTDEHRGYHGIRKYFYSHKAVNHRAKEYVNGIVHTNGIESVWAVLKRGIHGTFHHVSKKHLQRYLDEFTFRLNEGNCEVDTIDRMEALVKNMGNKKLSYKELISD